MNLVDTEPCVLWRAGVCDRQVIAPGRYYGWTSNKGREPDQTVVVQATLAGEAVLEDAAGVHLSAPGSLMLFVYGEFTSYRKVNRASVYDGQWVNLEGAGLIAHIDVLRRRHGPVLNLGNIDIVLAEMDELTALAHPSSPRRSDDPVVIARAVHALIMRLFELSERATHRTSRRVDMAVALVLRQPTRPWSIKEYASHYGVSREHLSRVFQQKTGQSVHAWIAAARLREAMRLLQETDLPISQVACQAGYVSPHHLARCVRTAKGCAPTEVRLARRSQMSAKHHSGVTRGGGG